MLVVTRQIGGNVFIYDYDDGSLELVDKGKVLEALKMGIDIKGISADGTVTKVDVNLKPEQCKWLPNGMNIFEHIESLKKASKGVYEIVCLGKKFKFKYVTDDVIQFTNNICVTNCNRLLRGLM